jgi:hypothetical protein
MPDSWLDVKRSTYPALRANVMTHGGTALTEEMLIEGAKTFKAYLEALHRRRVENAPWALKVGRVAGWLWDSGRTDEACRLIVVAQAISEWGATNQGSLDFLNGVMAEYDKRQP